eukprot:COSAG05_NODE_94_length_19565_cov_15.870133_6_plen_81_part_00
MSSYGDFGHLILAIGTSLVGISPEVWAIFGINNVTVMMRTKKYNLNRCGAGTIGLDILQDRVLCVGVHVYNMIVAMVLPS